MNQEQKSDNIHLTKLKKIKWSPSVKELTFRDLNYQWIEFCNKSNKEITVNQEAILSTEKPKNSFAKKTILTLVTLVGIGGAGFFAYNLQIKSNAPLEQLEPKEIDYTKFIDDWNKQVQHNTVKKEFLLNRNSNDKMIEQLENWMKNFYIPKVTESLEYNQFLEKNKFGKPTYFNTSMSRDEIREFLKKTTKEKVMSKIVKKVLMMNDMEIWKKLGK
ncbi:hypothetical protein MNB_SV-14-1262 [hydrothermal vent metagenome]|uniref:Uncharacterized protein n=1 Tax=hydrothermal vent metagenome TaxID=652676 RepID=A0A1W1CRN6_9ZZZZ